MSDQVVEKLPWPYGKRGAFALAVDDLHPESSSDKERLDYGGDKDKGKFRYLDELSRRQPALKVTLFLVPSWMDRPEFPRWNLLSRLDPVVSRTILRSNAATRFARRAKRRRHYPADTYRIDKATYRPWCRWLANKIGTGRFEVAMHGFHHYNPNAPFSSQEFYSMGSADCEARLREAEEMCRSAGIPFVAGFRPPAWSIGQELIEALGHLGYLFMAASADYSTTIARDAKANAYGIRGVDLLRPEVVGGMVAITSNSDVSTWRRSVEAVDAGGLGLLDVHIAKTTYSLSHVSREFVDTVDELVSELRRRHHDDVWFASLSEIAQFRYVREKASATLGRNRSGQATLKVTNPTVYHGYGLTLHVEGEPRLAQETPSLARSSLSQPGTISVDLPPRTTIELELGS